MKTETNKPKNELPKAPKTSVDETVTVKPTPKVTQKTDEAKPKVTEEAKLEETIKIKDAEEEKLKDTSKPKAHYSPCNWDIVCDPTTNTITATNNRTFEVFRGDIQGFNDLLNGDQD